MHTLIRFKWLATRHGLHVQQQRVDTPVGTPSAQIGGGGTGRIAVPWANSGRRASFQRSDDPCSVGLINVSKYSGHIKTPIKKPLPGNWTRARWIEKVGRNGGYRP